MVSNQKALDKLEDKPARYISTGTNVKCFIGVRKMKGMSIGMKEAILCNSTCKKNPFLVNQHEHEQDHLCSTKVQTTSRILYPVLGAAI